MSNQNILKFIQNMVKSNITKHLETNSVNIIDTLDMEITAESIDYFYLKSVNRSNNDNSNKIRENIISKIFEVYDSFKDHEIYGSKWCEFYSQLQNMIHQGFNAESYDSVSIKQTAGRKFNYDFIFTYKKNNIEVYNTKIEFKFGCHTIFKLPQILQLNSDYEWMVSQTAQNNEVVPSYQSYYYDFFMDRYLQIDNRILPPKVSKEEYLKYIRNVDVTKCPLLFQEMKKYDDKMYRKEKDLVVDESIKTYLELYKDHFDLIRFSNKLKESQTGKKYMMWMNGEFRMEVIPEQELEVKTILGLNKQANSILISSDKICYKVLLRWKNHKGILNPAWQISLSYL
jgi:hypothetical protein